MRDLKPIVMAFCALGVLFPYEATSAKAPTTAPPMLTKRCMNCHKDYKTMKDIVTGTFKSRSGQAGSIQVKVDSRMQVVKYTPETAVKNVPNIEALKPPIPMRIHYKRVGNDLVATKIVAKPKMKVPKKQLMSTEELEKLVTLGPEKGGYTLVDSRPAGQYQDGHIPTAISIPFPKMKQLKDRLPKDKNRLLIFYCAGWR